MEFPLRENEPSSEAMRLDREELLRAIERERGPRLSDIEREYRSGISRTGDSKDGGIAVALDPPLRSVWSLSAWSSSS
jgi:hypothetical protein